MRRESIRMMNIKTMMLAMALGVPASVVAQEPESVRPDDRPKGGQSVKRMMMRVTPFLMFEGQAETAMKHYTTLFPGASVESVDKYGPNEAGKEGTIRLATITIAGQRIMCIDSPVKHEFQFTPSFSLFVDCESEEQIAELFTKLSEGGKVLMPLDDYGFSEKFGWVSDRFGVSWQLNLPKPDPK